MGTKSFERILDYRKNSETGQEELLIKYKYSSFLHVEWVPLARIQGEHLGKHRVKKFLDKYHMDGDKGEDFSEQLKVDRVVDDGELEDPETGENKIYYLVKWNGTFYDSCTWETEEDIRKVDPTKLTEFISRKIIPPEKLAPPQPRPEPYRFVQYNASPRYKYNNSLRSYQLEGLNWLRFCYYNHRSCILADEMGLGKTVQSVALLQDIYYNLNIRGPFIIVAPLSTIPHWTRAFQAWTDLNVIDFRGSTLSRNLLIETEFYYHDPEGNNIPNRYKFDVLITTYEMASAGAGLLKDIRWRAGVFDEAHRLKNKNSKVLEILKTFYIEHKLLLTGTPLQNNLDELYSLLHFMSPDIFDDERYFFQEYGSLKTAQEVEKIQAFLKPIMLRRFKEDVEKTIPVKEETVIEVELTNPQKKWYRAILEKNFSFLKKGTQSNKEMPHLRNIMMQLRKCCIHPYLLEGAEDVIVSECNARTAHEQFSCLVQSSGKLVLIDKLLKKLILGNHKVLIFSQFTSCLDILADYLRGRHYAYERIDGSIPGDQRQAAIDRFSTLPIEESFVFLLCTRAGGVGINLTAADTCIIFDSDWNPQNDLQAQARCHRIGQTKPVQIYRLICSNTYEKDMFDRAGMKLGLDKAVMGTHDDGNVNKTSELNRKEIENLLKKGAYGAIFDEEASSKFCEEDIDQILERRTTVIKHEGNEKGSVFSKATFSAAAEDGNAGVDLDDPDFWEKWAAKAHIETNADTPDEDSLIVFEPRKRRQVQRFGSRPADGSYSSNDNAEDSDVYEDEEPSRRRSDQARLWTLSEKTKYERKLMIYGYGRWDLMKPHFSRRSEKDLKAVTRALMRKVLPTIEKNTEEDRKLIEDINEILSSDVRDEVRKNDSIPYVGATKRQIAEFKSFLKQAPADYIDHIERKGRNFLLRIQMLHLIRDKIVPADWEEAKVLEIPKVTGSPPAPWWREKEDRCLLLGICKYGYQQYLAMRNDPEFTFYGRKYDDSLSGALEDDDSHDQQSLETPIVNKKVITGTKRKGMSDDDEEEEEILDEEDDDDSDYDDKKDGDFSEEEYEQYVWPSKADIGMRLRRIIAAFLRERASHTRQRKMMEKVEKKEKDRKTRQHAKETRAAQRQRARINEVSHRWSKKHKGDFLKTLMSFGLERRLSDKSYDWHRFKEIAGLDKKTDESLTAHCQETLLACEEAVKRHQTEVGSNTVSPAVSRESSMEPQDEIGDIIPYDKARRALKRVEQMKVIREQILVHPELDELLQSARKTSGLPSWWLVPDHDKALLEGISKHGMGRSDLIIEDPELPFYHIKQSRIVDNDEDHLNWPRDLVVARRIDALCELVLNPKPMSKRQTKNLLLAKPHD
ncbi:P-loop containing nucleoside triphosphate hydrolase protein [Pilobolus umbonatus]|nr:P-loop containing nucleoside triphosphate hydrolase protein [Pilobolus umbonatus]